MGDLNHNQTVQLELMDFVHKVCREEGIKYTLLVSSTAAWKEYGGFAPFMARITVGMLYPYYLQFMDVCKRKSGQTGYYIAGRENCEQYDEMGIRLAKRGVVKLSGKRKKDEVYYDCFIDILPVYYAGNTEKECRHMIKEYVHYRKCVNAQKILKNTVKLNNCIRMAKRAHYYRQKEQYSYEKTEKTLTRYGTERTKYVFIPTVLCRQKGISCLADTYLDIQESEFEGHPCCIMRDVEQWIDGYYGKKEYEELLGRKINKSLIVGQEMMRRIQLIELEMLVEFDRICRKHGLKYVLGWGTLLGAVRHGGFIPWDDDVDVFMLYEDYVRFIELAEKELDKERFFLKTQETDHDCNLTFIQIKRNGTVYSREGRETYDTHPGVFIDILPFFNGSNSRVVHKMQHKICAFYKTMVWSHLGAAGAVRHRRYYMWLSRVSNKTAYRRYMKWATLVKKPNGKLAMLSYIRNPYNTVYTRRESVENTVEMDFEGHSFYVPANYKDVLCYMYTEDYLKYPPIADRAARHLPAHIEIGSLFQNAGEAERAGETDNGWFGGKV